MTFRGVFASMVSLAMKGFTSRTVLFSLVTSVALSLAPQVTAQESGGAAVAAQETARRQQALRDAMQQVQEARLAYTAGRYSDAVEHYRNALAVVPKAPATDKQVKFIKDSLADALVAKGMDYRKVGRRDEAIEFMKEAMEVSPGHKFARQELERTQDPQRTNPSLTPQHLANVEEVNRLLSLAYGYYDLGEYDKSEESFDAVLRIDRYNTAAQRGKELISKARSRYYRSAHDATRAARLAEVDAAWEEPAPDENPVMELAATESGAAVQQDAETQNRIAAALKAMKISQIAFEEASVQEVVEALQGQIRRFEAQGVGAGRSINLVPNFGATDSEGYKTIMSRRVTLSLNDVSLHDLLSILDKQLGITHYITPVGVELSYSGRDFGPLVERVYTVPPHFFDAQREEGGDEDEDDFSSSSSRVVVRRVNPVVALKEMGVSFPEGANARYDAASRLLTVRNTAYNQEEIEELISMPLETDRAVVLNVIAMEVNESDLNELGFEWMFNFSLGPKTFTSGTKEALISDVTGLPTFGTDVELPQESYAATSGLRSGRSVLTTDNVDNLIRSGRAGMYDSYNAAAGKAPGILSFRGVWNSGDVTMIMRGAAQKKGADVLTNPRIVFTPGRDEQVVFANIKEMFYPETYAEPQIATTSFNLGTETTLGTDGEERDRNVNGRATIASPAHPESFIRFGTNEDAVGGIGSVIQVHDATVAPDGRHVTMALTVTLNEFEGFVNWGTPIYSYLMTDDSDRAVRMELTSNQILKPVFKRRMENTKLTVGSGSVVVIGGLKEARSVRYEDKLPILGDLPMVGRLFRSEGEEKIRKAFLMFVKVDVVDPTGRVIGTGERPSDVTD